MTEDRALVTKMLGKYRSLLRRFVGGEISPQSFETDFLSLFKNDQDQVVSAEFDVLDGLFADVDDYCEDDTLRIETGGISGDELRNRARAAYSRLFDETL